MVVELGLDVLVLGIGPDDETLGGSANGTSDVAGAIEEAEGGIAAGGLGIADLVPDLAPA